MICKKCGVELKRQRRNWLMRFFVFTKLFECPTCYTSYLWFYGFLLKRLFLFTIVSIFAAEAVIMFTISKFTSFTLSTQAIIDSLILICVVIPILYFFLAKPLRLNIVARKKLEKEVETLSISDKLTGFYNRRGFFVLGEDQLKLAEREKREKVLFCAGLDFLKYINYNLGYQIGDNILIETAGIIRKSFYESDIIARIGGDEFAILADGMHEDGIQRLVSRLKTNLDAYNAKAGKTCEISLSIGIKRYNPESPCSIDKLLSDADELMYEEKNLKGKILV